MKKFMNAVIYGGIAILAAVFLGLFIDGLLESFVPQETYDNNSTTTPEYEEFEGSLLDLAQSYFLPAYFMIVIIGLLLVLVNIADEMGK